MSAEHVGWAFRQKGLTSSQKFVLVALADRCNKDTLRCDPSVGKLMEDTGLTRMTIHRALNAMEEAGFITRVRRTRENGSLTSNEYRFPSITMIRGDYHSDTPPTNTVIHPEPELRTRTKPSLPSARPRNEIWDALAYVFGEPTTPSATKVRGKVCAGLKAAGARPDQITARASAWPKHFDGATMTDLALEKHWDTLGRKPLRRR